MSAEAKPVRWAILGTGTISTKFATALRDIPDASIAAVGSRTAERARVFGTEFGVPESGHCASNAAAVAHPDVEIVYIGTPHECHVHDALLAIEAGKHVLCEKPLTIHVGESERLVAAAKAKGVLLMEAMWTRFIPAYRSLKALVSGGSLGHVVLLAGDFGFKGDPGSDLRLYDKAQGGGSLLDVGVYPLSLAVDLLGEPVAVRALGCVGAVNGVDESLAAVLQHPGGALSTISSSIVADTHQEATIVGTLGRVRVHSPWWKPTGYTVSRDGADDEVVHLPHEGNGYKYQALEAVALVREGKLESPTISLAQSLCVMRVMDEIRAQVGVSYPMDPAPV